MWIPVEIVNIIFEYCDKPLYLYYDRKRGYLFKINPKHDFFSKIRSLYEKMILHTSNENDKYHTQILYEIPIRKIPSFPNLLTRMNNMVNYMLIVIIENDDELLSEHHTSIVIETERSALLIQN
jgi:hypothetical protein